MTNQRQRRQRHVPTYVPGLDDVLCGGLLRGGLYVVRGAPGSGKTILGNQICFAHARRGGRSAYATLLAESHARMMVHLETLDFFDEELADDRVRYLSAYGALMKHGLRGVLDFIQSALQERPKPGRKGKGKSKSDSHEAILVIDGFLVISDQSTSVTELKKFMQELQLYADLIGATVLLLAGPAVDESRPEYTMVDGIIELDETIHGLRAHREVRVRKLRGGPHLRGGHVFTITSAGLTVYPRAESVFGAPSHLDRCGDDLVPTGIEQLDKMLNGGLRSGTTTLVLGPSGSGKTTLSLHYLAAAPKGTKSLYFGFYETPERLLSKARALNLALDRRVRSGELHIVWQPSTEQNVDALVQHLFHTIENNKITRLVIDGLDGFQRATLHPLRVHHIFTAMANELRIRGVTTLYTYEVSNIIGNSQMPITGVSALAENLLYLRFAELRSRIYRLLSVLKVRDSSYDTSLREFHITDHGIKLEKSYASAEALLAGTPIER
jgi:circadian clock protein KaiC